MKQIPSLPSLTRTQRAGLGAILLLLALPSILLWKSLFGGDAYIPFDNSFFPPQSVLSRPEELKARESKANFDITEKTLICSVEYELARNEIAEGRFPLWNPYVRSGAPLLANALDGFAYPTHWLLLAFDANTMYGFVAWLAFAMAGLFMYGFAREIGLDLVPALLSAVTFQLSGTLAANAHFFMRMETLVWLPAGFWALERLYKQEGIRRVPSFCGFAISVALTWLAGFPPYALACSMAFGLYILQLTHRTKRESGWKPASRYVAWTTTAVLLGIMLASVQLIPMLDYFPDSARDLDRSAVTQAQEGLDPIAWAGFVMPSPFGDPISGHEVPYDKNPLTYLLYSRRNPETGNLFLPAYNYTEYALYLGVFPLLCLLFALLHKSVRFRWFGFGCFLLFAALAQGGFLFRLLAWLPAFRSMPPMRLVGVVAFFGAILAGIGLQNGPTMVSRRRHLALMTGTIVLMVLCLGAGVWASYVSKNVEARSGPLLQAIVSRWKPSFPIATVDFVRGPEFFTTKRITESLLHFAGQAFNAAFMLGLGVAWLFVSQLATKWHDVRLRWARRLLPAVAVAFTLAELLPLASRVNPTFPHYDAPETSVHQFLRTKAKEAAKTGGFMVARAAKTVTLPTAFPPNLLIPLGIRDLNAYAFLDGRSHKPFEKLYGPSQMIQGKTWLNAFPADERLGYGLFDLFGVRYLLSNEELPELGKPATQPLEGPGGKFFIYERKTALPRAFLVPRAKVVENDEAAIDHLTAKDFDPRDTVFLDQRVMDQDDPPPIRQCSAPDKIAHAKVEFLKDTPRAIRIYVKDSPGAWLVMTDTAMPHWRMLVDAVEKPWWRADLCFRSLWIPPGSHRIDLSYDPSPFHTGLYLTIAAIALVLLLMAWWNGTPKGVAKDADTDVVDIEDEDQ